MAVRVVTLALVLLLLPAGVARATGGDPPGCTQQLQYDPSIPTFAQVAAANPGFTTNNGQSVNALGGFQTGTNNRHPTADLQTYQQAIADATVANTRVSVVIKTVGTSEGGRPMKIAIAGTPAHIASLETDAAFWRGVRAGSITAASARATLSSSTAPPAFGWVTSGVHGNEPAGGEAAMRLLYELAARTDCANQQRLANLTVFIDPVRNPDARDNNTRTNAFAFDTNRDLAFQTQDVDGAALDAIDQYPGLFLLDAHQQTSGLFLPPYEDPALHELSSFSVDTVQETIGPALQERFNGQGLQYRSYNGYDLFAPTAYTATSLFMGTGGVTVEKGTNEVYGKQVYDLYLAMDETLSVVSARKAALAKAWAAQWGEAAAQGTACTLQSNRLISALHQPPSGTIFQQPGSTSCGYYFKAGRHTGDVARVLDLLRGRDVKVYKLDSAVAVTGSHDFGETGVKAQTLPAGTLYIPAGQTLKHWLHAMLEEDPSIAVPAIDDVFNWSFPELFDLGGAGQLQAALPAVAMTQLTGVTSLGGVTGGGSPVLAFATDSSKALGLVTQLLGGGASVARAGVAFDAAGTHFPTGAALVDAATLGSLDLPALSAAAQTPVFGLPAYPVSRFELTVPKIALYTGATTTPTSPVVFPGGGSGHCTSTAYCEMVFAMAKELNVPVARLVPFTSTDLAAGALVAQGFTAIINPGSTIAAGAGATALQAFVNAGGRYVTYNNNGATSARNAGLTTLNASPTNVAPFTTHCADNPDPAAAGSLTTPGTAFSATFDVSNPVAWGFDEGGYIYRDANANSVFDGATVDTATAVVSYADPLVAFGYQCNATAAGALPGRPYAVDQPFGAGHATMFGSDVFFRGWTAGAQRLVMNAVLYPAFGPVTPLSKARLRPVRSRPVIESHDPRTDTTIVVRASQAAALRTIVRTAKVPHRVAFARRGNRVTLTIRGAYREPELRPAWAWRIIEGMTRRKLTPIAHHI
jgi:hypothetical protein